METVQEARVTARVQQVHEIYLRATPQAIWDALTTPEWTARYGYHAPAVYDLKRGGRYTSTSTEAMRKLGLPETIIDGEVLEARPPHKLVQTFRFLFNAEHEAEGYTRVTWEIVPTESGYCRLTVTHDLTGAPLMAASTASKVDGAGGGGWTWIISDLKSLLETGKSMQ
jgi:uncharacterized protein YndB with AHSA1/START domain